MARVPATTTCPSCDAPAPAGARRCTSCGYRFLEAGPGPGAPERPSLRSLALYGGALAAAAVAAVLAVGALGGGDGDVARSSEPHAHLDIISQHPISTPGAERLLKRRYIGTRNDESASVRCSARVPKPAHSVRRCIVHYPGGIERIVVLLTSANGAEVISKP